MPNVSSSWSLDGAIKYQYNWKVMQDYLVSTKFDVMTPQFYGFELSDVVEETGVSPGGQGSFSLL